MRHTLWALLLGLACAASAVSARVFEFPAAEDAPQPLRAVVYGTTDIEATEPLIQGFQRLYPDIAVVYHELNSLELHERALAEQWLLVDRSVFEVDEVRHGHGMTVRDVRTGDRHEVRERTGSRMVAPGQLICARAVPAGDTVQFFGGLEPVALHERDALIALLDIEPDPIELIEARLFSGSPS